MQRYLYEDKFRPVNDHAMAWYLNQKSKILFANVMHPEFKENRE